MVDIQENIIFFPMNLVAFSPLGDGCQKVGIWICNTFWRSWILSARFAWRPLGPRSTCARSSTSSVRAAWIRWASWNKGISSCKQQNIISYTISVIRISIILVRIQIRIEKIPTYVLFYLKKNIMLKLKKMILFCYLWTSYFLCKLNKSVISFWLMFLCVFSLILAEFLLPGSNTVHYIHIVHTLKRKG